METENEPRGVFTEHFLGDVALGQIFLDLSQRKFFQLWNVVLQTTLVLVFVVDCRVDNHFVGESVDGFG
jgi:hypothetical protein